MTERILELDALRGFALLGILVVNFPGFCEPVLYLSSSDLATRWPGPADRFVAGAVDLLATGKFLGLFALLLGIGVAIQDERARRIGRPFWGTHSKRMVGLFLIGLAHGLVVWYGDILQFYALLAMPLLLFRRASPRTLMTWSAALMLVPAMAFGGWSVYRAHTGAPSPESRPDHRIEASYDAYGGRAYGPMLRQRLADLSACYEGAPFVAPRVLGLFLLGMWTWRSGLFRNLERRRRAVGRCALLAIAAGLVGVLAARGLRAAAVESLAPHMLRQATAAALSVAGTTLMTFGYAAGVTVLLRARLLGRPLARNLGAVGRTALSNYLLQSLLATSVCYGYGLGGYGGIGPAAGTAIAAGIFLAQVAGSRLWLRRFSRGPVESAWRAWTYRSAAGG